MERVDISHNSDVALIVEDKLELRVSSVVSKLADRRIDSMTNELHIVSKAKPSSKLTWILIPSYRAVPF